MWVLFESDRVIKRCSRLPRQILKKYELWKAIVRYNGPAKLRDYKGFHDERLRGEWNGCRSSRLNIQYRVIYTIDIKNKGVYIEDINPHEY